MHRAVHGIHQHFVYVGNLIRHVHLWMKRFEHIFSFRRSREYRRRETARALQCVAGIMMCVYLGVLQPPCMKWCCQLNNITNFHKYFNTFAFFFSSVSSSVLCVCVVSVCEPHTSCMSCTLLLHTFFSTLHVHFFYININIIPLPFHVFLTLFIFLFLSACLGDKIDQKTHQVVNSTEKSKKRLQKIWQSVVCDSVCATVK